MNIVRSLVSGKKMRTSDGEFDLDLTYITKRIIAMSFPASQTIQKIYRNSVNDVAQFLDSNHFKNYWVINLSEQNYS
jgi:phosphatidylinositol-3,4,5-trisphosphate 3-phosphatase/dual-specificity protein phosphatase PTEN